MTMDGTMVTEEPSSIDYKGREYPALYTLPSPSTASGYAVILTHGAGGDMHFPQLTAIANALARAGHLCLRFTCKGLNLTHRSNVYMAVIGHILKSKGEQLKGCFLAGRSMGSRAAVVTANQLNGEDKYKDILKGVLCFAYPLHKPKDEGNLRDGPPLDLQLPCLFVSGTQDEMCRQDLLEELLEQRELLQVCWVQSGNHGFKVKGQAEAAVVDDFMGTVNEWISQHIDVKGNVQANGHVLKNDIENQKKRRATKRKKKCWRGPEWDEESEETLRTQTVSSFC